VLAHNIFFSIPWITNKNIYLLDISTYVFSGKIVPSKYLWVGNISVDIKRRDLEHAFSRYGVIKSLDYSTGDPTAIVTYMDVEDAIKARSKLMGAIQLLDGRIVRNESDSSYRGKKIR
jgi:RNA recognition motif-containing protein